MVTLNSSIVVVGDNVSYIIPSSARMKSTAEAPYYSSVFNLPQGRVTLSIEQPLPETPLDSTGAKSEAEVTRDHIYDTLGELQIESEEQVNDESKESGDQTKEDDGEN